VQAMGRIALTDGVEGRVVIDNKACFIEAMPNADEPHKIWVDKEGIHGLAVVPITRPKPQVEQGAIGSHVIGVLAAGTISQGYHVWSPREMRLLTSIANQVALAIDNARMHERLQENEVALRAGNEVLRNVNDMLLEKSAFLEGFIQDDLSPVLDGAVPFLQRLLVENPGAFSKRQQQGLVALQKKLYQLNNLARETTDMSEVLDHEVDQTIEENEQGLVGPIKPIRLEKKSAPEPQRPEANNQAAEVTQAGSGRQPPVDVEAGADPEVRAMSFEEAVAAGLVPANIIDREKSDK
jgi:hypothetical protein